MTKYRQGFVSNSSSSSFVCDVCGYETSGYDMCLSEAGMVQCENGHELCEEHLLELSKKQAQSVLKRLCECGKISQNELNDFIKENNIDIDHLTFKDIKLISNELGYGDFRYSVPECLCPLCNFEELSDSDTMLYLQKEYNIPEIEVFEELKKINPRRKKLRDKEYNEYVLRKINSNITQILKEVEDRFDGSYKKFREYIR